MATPDSARNQGVLRSPVYDGKEPMLTDKTMQVNQYFLGTAVAQWNLADFILSTGLMEATFLADLQKIRRAKRLPSPIRLFAYAMIKYYNGEVGRHNIEIAQLEALKRLNRTKLTLKSYLLAQKDAEHEMGQDIAVQSVNVLAAEEGCSSSATAAASSQGQVISRSKKPAIHSADDPWHELLLCLEQVINGYPSVSFPHTLEDMKHEHRILFNHAVVSLKEYMDQADHDKDVILIEDAKVDISCVINTMSDRVCEFFEAAGEENLLAHAKRHSQLDGFNTHPCSKYLDKYHTILAKNGISYLRKRLTVDRGRLQEEYMHMDRMPDHAELEHSTLRVLIELCDFIVKPAYGSADPSKTDCMRLWMQIFGILTKKLTIHIREASEIVPPHRQVGSRNEIDSGRKMYCLFMYGGLEISNVECKHPRTTEKEMAVRFRENVCLALALQAAHGAPVLAADITGFAGTFFQVLPMGDVIVAGAAASDVALLPRTAGALQQFLKSASLPMIWNFISFLERQASEICLRQQQDDLDQDMIRHRAGVSLART